MSYTVFGVGYVYQVNNKKCKKLGKLASKIAVIDIKQQLLLKHLQNYCL